jgi:hypothetical protein
MQENNTTKQLFAKTLELEKQLRTAFKANGPLDKSAFQLRDALRESYEKLVFSDYEFATSKDVEINLWKNVYYKVIEEFRKRIRKSASKSQESQSQNSDRTGSLFKAFLEQSTQFYNNFIAKLQSTFNLQVDKPVPEDISDTNSTLYKQYLSCHRSLTYLGDLARYIRDINPKSREWMASAQHYKRALKLMPSWGNPHNQLAVLNTYCDDEFNAVYHYFRSLAVTHPFLTARDNLNVLLEKNKVKVEDSKPSSQSSGRGGKSQNAFIEEADLTSEARAFLSKFVRLHGILFTKTSLEAWRELETKVLAEFDQLLRKEHLPDSVLLKIFVVNIFTFNNINNVPDGITPSYIEIGQRTELQKYSLSLALEMFLAVMRIGVKLNTKLPKNLMSLSIFSDWMKYNCLYLKKSEFSEDKWISLRETTVSFLNYITGVLVNNMAEDISTSMKRPLVEELELQGFLPLKESFQLVDFQEDVMTDNSLKNIDDRVLGILKRMTKIKAFGLILANYQVPDTDEKIVYYSAALNKFSLKPTDEDQINTQDQAVNKLSQLKANPSPMDAEEIQSTPISSLPKSGVQFLNSPLLANGNFPRASSNNNSFLHIDASNLSMEPPQMDQEDEEVILFKPTNSNVKNEVVSPTKARPEHIGSSSGAGSNPSSQPNMPPLVNVASGSNANNRGPTGWDLFASQAQQQPQYNNNALPNPVPLSTQVMGGQMYSPFGNYGSHMVASNPPGFSSQGSQPMVATPQQQQFGGFFGSSTDYNNPFGNSTKANPLNAQAQPPLNMGPAANNNGNVPSVFNSIWSSEPADKKSPRYTAMPHVAVNAPPGFNTVNGESVIDNPFNRSTGRGNNAPQMPPPQLLQMAVNIPGFTQLPLLQQQQILSQLQAHAMQSKPFS